MPADAAAAPGFLSNVLVVECADTPAPAFAAALAGDFGATVVICEAPPHGSGLRRLGPAAVRELWWPVIARNKNSLALDVTHPGAAPVLDRLGQRSDMLLRGDGPGGAALAARLCGHARAIDVHLYAPGADRPDLWPWSTQPEFAAAASGLMALTGMPDGPAVQPEIPLADYCAAMMALMAALAELRAARGEGRAPRPQSFALHEALHRMNEWQVIVATAFGRPELRNGNRFPMNANVGNVFKTRDGKLLTVSAATPPVASRLLNMIGGPALRDDPRFATPAARRLNMDALETHVAAWMARHDAAEAMRLVAENDVVVGPICDAADLGAEPHVAARGDISHGAGQAMPAALPRTSPEAGTIRHAGPAIGADTGKVLGLLGFTEAEISGLRRSGAVWSPAAAA